MKRFFLGLSFLVLSNIHAQTWTTEEEYIQKFAGYAVEEMEKYKIPASITLAQGLLETGGGQSRLAKQGNNHFGIKCKEDWTGKSMSHTDDAPNECFRVYDDPKQSYNDHSIFLSTRKFYTKLFDLDMKDYKAWAHGLKKAGYATNPKYAYILIGKIEKFKLYEFDNTNSKEVLYILAKLYPELNNDKGFLAKLNQKSAIESSKKSVPPSVKKESLYAKASEKPKEKSKVELLNGMLVKNHPNGGVKYVVLPADTNVRYIAFKYGISESKIMKWNELDSPELKFNQIVFLEAKNNDGNIDTYKVENGEKMYDVAQKFAIRLDRLYAKNRMGDGQQPSIGQLMYLKDKKPK